MGHERSITFPVKRKKKKVWVNTPGVSGGESISEDHARKLLKRRKIKQLGRAHPTVEAAEKAAGRRSERFGKMVDRRRRIGGKKAAAKLHDRRKHPRRKK